MGNLSDQKKALTRVNHYENHCLYKPFNCTNGNGSGCVIEWRRGRWQELIQNKERAALTSRDSCWSKAETQRWCKAPTTMSHLHYGSTLPSSSHPSLLFLNASSLCISWQPFLTLKSTRAAIINAHIVLMRELRLSWFIRHMSRAGSDIKRWGKS